MKILKYQLEITNRQEIEMAAGSKVIKAGVDPDGKLCVWVLVPKLLTPRHTQTEIFIRGTGHEFEMDEYVDYIDSVVHGRFVWHVFVNKR